ncbi:regulator [Bacillus paranthracis]|nr:regulator [Bacillus thuringiensis serovar finitimus]QCU13261.1 regulator [Bacillus paranthracis]TBL14308.1 regulator [Bacillus paranthracis]TNP18916.1 regulator [Bacillus sp. CD3-5]
MSFLLCKSGLWIEKKGYSRSLMKWHLEIYHSWEDSKELVVELLDTVE